MVHKNKKYEWFIDEWRARNNLSTSVIYPGMPTWLQVKTGLINATLAHLKDTKDKNYHVLF